MEVRSKGTWFVTFFSVNSKDVSADGSDFTLPPTSITFQPDDNLLKTVNISIAIDDKVELDEKFELMLTTNDNQVIINDNKMTITIVDNDGRAYLSKSYVMFFCYDSH